MEIIVLCTLRLKNVKIQNTGNTTKGKMFPRPMFMLLTNTTSCLNCLRKTFLILLSDIYQRRYGFKHWYTISAILS